MFIKGGKKIMVNDDKFIPMYKKTIQEHLNEVDYSFKDFIPSKEALMMFQFIKEVNGGREENKSPIIHSLMIDKMCSNHRRVAILAHRGCSKSSLLEYLMLYLACFGSLGKIEKPMFALGVFNSVESGVKTFRDSIEGRYANSDFLQKMIPNQNLKLLATDSKSGKDLFLSDNDIVDISNAGRYITDLRIEFKNINGESFVIKTYGVKSGIRGAKARNKRPTLAFFDDLLSDDDARSDTILEGVEEIVYKAVPYALHPTKQKIIWVGTPFNSKDPLYKAIESGRWDSLVLPVCEKFPCSEEEFKGSWEDRFTYESVLEAYNDALARGKADGFYQELMLQIVPDDELLIKKEDIRFIDNKELDKVNTTSYNYYITTDFAFSEKTSADYSVISVWAYTSNEDFILVDGVCRKQTMDLNILDLFKLVSKYRPLQVGIEVTGQQGGFVQWILKEQTRTKIYFDIKEIRPTRDKFSRFLAFATLYKRAKVFIYAGMRKQLDYYNEFMDELQKVTKTGFKAKHDDVLDTNSMLLDLDLYKPLYEEKRDIELPYGFGSEFPYVTKSSEVKNNYIF